MEEAFKIAKELLDSGWEVSISNLKNGDYAIRGIENE